MPEKKFIKAWDDIIDIWLNNQTSNPLIPLSICKHLSVEHMPEPYNGDPSNCSIVMINLNPGQGQIYLEWANQHNPTFCVNLAKNKKYQGFARPFTFLNPPSQQFSPQSTAWWQGRKSYLDKLLQMKCVNSVKNPFAIELCALHSVGTNGISFKKYLSKLKSVNPDLDLTKIIEIAIANSDAKLGFAVGKPIYEALKSIGYADIQISPHNVIKANGERNARQFAVVEKDGAKVLCTWTSGSNSCPSAEFDNYIGQDIMPLL